MLVYRITKSEFSEDLSGQGAFLYGGRWNYKGERMLYASENPSLALLENLVHLSRFQILPDLQLVSLNLDSEHIFELKEDKLPLDWRKNPAPFLLKALGSEFLLEEKYLAMKVPSVVIPVDKNILINPLNPDFKSVAIVDVQHLALEERLR
jgi:RES domain-containing protein